MTRATDDTWRTRHRVLVTDAGTLAAIGVIRSLGRAGYRVIACASDPAALGLRSRFVSRALISPTYAGTAFLPWLHDTISRYAIDVIVPSEAVLLALRPAHGEFANLLAYSTDPETLYRGLSKFDLFDALGAQQSPSADHLPPTRLLDAAAPLPTQQELDALGWPLFIKADAAHARSADASSVTQRAANAGDAFAELDALRRRFDRMVIQGFVSGCGVGAFYLMHRGRVLAEFMHRRLHEVPHTGGISSLRASWRHEAIRADALAKLRALNWQGVAMMEYRWDPATDRFALMEMNGRFWGSLHLALHAGVDFPRMLVDAHLGHADCEVHDWPIGVRCRHTFPWEIQHVGSRLRDRRLTIAGKARSILEFAALSLDPRIHADLRFPGDSGLYWRNLVRFLPTILRRESQKSEISARSSTLVPAR